MNKEKDKQEDIKEAKEEEVSEEVQEEDEQGKQQTEDSKLDKKAEEIDIEVKTGDEEVDENEEQEEDTEEKEDDQKNAEEKLGKLTEEKEELNKKLKRLAAEFENYKKRAKEKEKERLKYDGKNVLKKLLPVFDDIDRAVQHQEESKESDSDNQEEDGGMKMIHKKLHNILEDLEIVKYDSEGEEFDPDRHHAIMTREDDEHDSNTVIEEIEKGYRYKDKILRYAKVIVSK